jgi:CDP-paratose 2-epimerase
VDYYTVLYVGIKDIVLMKLVIFGGVGFIGTNISKVALERGHTVIACDNLMRSGTEENLAYLKKFDRFHFQWCDIRNNEDISRLPRRVDCIINLAANPAIPRSIREPVFDFDINVRGHLNILEYSRLNGRIPIVFASSNKVYTDKLNTLEIKEESTRYVYAESKYNNGFSESMDVDGYDGFTNSPYGVAKLAAEKYTREYWKHYSIPMVINRMSCIYGEFQKGVEEQGWLDWFLRAKKAGKPIVVYGNGKQVRDVLFGRDVARLYLDEAEHIEKYNGNTFNVGGGVKKGFHVSLLETIALINEIFPGRPLHITYKNWRSSDQRIYTSNMHHVKSVTGWEPTTPLVDGLKSMWNSYAK